MNVARKVIRRLPRSVPSRRTIESVVVGQTIEAAARLLPARETRCSVMITGWECWRWPSFVEYALYTAGAPLEYLPGDGRRLYRRVGLKGLIKAHPLQSKAVPEGTPGMGVLIGNGGNHRTIVEIDENYYVNVGDAVALSACQPGDRAVMPYFAHPLMLERIDRRIIANDWEERPIRIGFAGTTAAAYERSLNFDMLNRQSILAHLRDEFAHSVEIAGDPETWTPTKPIALAVTNNIADNLVKHSRTGEAYLDFLGSAEFVLTPPGLAMPHSHNLVEAMSQGAIPILNYTRWVSPSLDPGVNCLEYRSLDQLSEVVRSALAMPLSQVREMRAEVLSYYERFLRPASVGRQIVHRQPSTLYVNAEGESVRLFFEDEQRFQPTRR